MTFRLQALVSSGALAPEETKMLADDFEGLSARGEFSACVVIQNQYSRSSLALLVFMPPIPTFPRKGGRGLNCCGLAGDSWLPKKNSGYN